MYMYIWVTLKGAESPQKKTDSCPCYRHVQSASQYLLSPLPAKTQICLDIDPSVKPKSKWSGWAQPLTSGCRKEKERGSHLLGAPIKVKRPSDWTSKIWNWENNGKPLPVPCYLVKSEKQANGWRRARPSLRMERNASWWQHWSLWIKLYLKPASTLNFSIR